MLAADQHRDARGLAAEGGIVIGDPARLALAGEARIAAADDIAAIGLVIPDGEVLALAGDRQEVPRLDRGQGGSGAEQGGGGEEGAEGGHGMEPLWEWGAPGGALLIVILSAISSCATYNPAGQPCATILRDHVAHDLYAWQPSPSGAPP
ncbi:hypothetical protein D9598_05775 [Roseomonas sp. KE0001]|nr:hypothetical protein [Roseomonas sp. KE0001]